MLMVAPPAIVVIIPDLVSSSSGLGPLAEAIGFLAAGPFGVFKTSP
jgi:hypothetical protein